MKSNEHKGVESSISRGEIYQGEILVPQRMLLLSTRSSSLRMKPGEALPVGAGIVPGLVLHKSYAHRHGYHEVLSGTAMLSPQPCYGSLPCPDTSASLLPFYLLCLCGVGVEKDVLSRSEHPSLLFSVTLYISPVKPSSVFLRKWVVQRIPPLFVRQH